MHYIKKNGKLKISAAESLVFVRYFGCIIGDYVPKGNEYWDLYLELRTIIHILTAVVINDPDISRLDKCIKRHHKLYMKLFKESLKPKFHFLLHYLRLLKKLGPLVHIWTMRAESKHAEVKLIATSTFSKRDLSLLISKRI